MRLLLRLAPLALLLLPTVPLAADEESDAADIAKKYASIDPEERAQGEKSVAAAPAEVLRRVLAALRGSPVPHPDAMPLPPPGTRLVHIEVRFLDVLPTAGARLGIMDATGKVRAGSLSAPDLERLLAAVETGTDIQQITAPSITVYDRQKATVSVSTEVSFIQEYDVEVACGSQIADPILGKVADGISLDVRPVVSHDGKTVLCEMAITSTEVVRPIAETKVRLGIGTGRDVTVQLPEVRTVKRAHRLVLASGEPTVLDAGVASFEPVEGGPRRVIAVMTVEALDLTDGNVVAPISPK